MKASDLWESEIFLASSEGEASVYRMARAYDFCTRSEKEMIKDAMLHALEWAKNIDDDKKRTGKGALL